MATAALCYWAGPGGSRQPANAVTTVASPITLLEQRGGACLAPGKWGPTGPSNGEAPQLRSLELASKMVPACLFHVLIFPFYYTRFFGSQIVCPRMLKQCSWQPGRQAPSTHEAHTHTHQHLCAPLFGLAHNKFVGGHCMANTSHLFCHCSISLLQRLRERISL